MKPGDVYPIKTGDPYDLPDGIPSGTLVKLLSFDQGYWTVEAEGRQFKVFHMHIECAWLYEVNGCWLDENDPRVIAERERH